MIVSVIAEEKRASTVRLFPKEDSLMRKYNFLGTETRNSAPIYKCNFQTKTLLFDVVISSAL